jgi:hypothetical protein
MMVEKRGMITNEMKEEYLQKNSKVLYLKGPPFEPETNDLKYTKRRQF